MKGKIIVIEGTDCSGKETQSKLLKDKLEKMGKKVIRFYFPYYESPTGKIIGGPYLGKPEICDSYFPEGSSHVDSYVSCLYYAADRKYNMDNVITSKNQRYKFGKSKVDKLYMDLLNANKWYYATNLEGSLVDNYVNNAQKQRLFD